MLEALLASWVGWGPIDFSTAIKRAVVELRILLGRREFLVQTPYGCRLTMQTSSGERLDRQCSRLTVQRCLRFVKEASSLKGIVYPEELPGPFRWGCAQLCS